MADLKLGSGKRAPGMLAARSPIAVKRSNPGMGAQPAQAPARTSPAPVKAAAVLTTPPAPPPPRPVQPKTTKTPLNLPQVRKAHIPPSSAVWPNVSVPSVSAPKDNAVRASTTVTRNSVASRTCSSCKAALSPNCLAQGTALVIDNALLCIDCIKTGKKRSRRPELSRKTLFITFGAIAVLLIAMAIFIPGQVLLVSCLLSVGGILTGLLGFTLQRTARLSLAAAGIAALGLSVWGLTAIRARANSVMAVDSLSSEVAAIKNDLAHNCYYEATRRIAAIKEKTLKENSNAIPSQVKKQVDELSDMVEAWFQSNYGSRSDDERELLNNLWRKFGSVTSGSIRHFRAVRIAGNSVQLTVAMAPAGPDERVKSSAAGQTLEHQLLEQSEPLIQTVLKRREVDTVELTIVSTSGDNPPTLATLTLDEKAVSDVRLGKWIALRKSIRMESK